MCVMVNWIEEKMNIKLNEMKKIKKEPHRRQWLSRINIKFCFLFCSRAIETQKENGEKVV